MSKTNWNLFFDFHGVLADVDNVKKNYQYYLQRILALAGISEVQALRIHDKGLNKWLNEINQITSDFNEGILSSTEFMEEYQAVDRKWGRFILSFVPVNKQEEIMQHLIPSVLEYEALASGKHSILYPEVNAVLLKLKEFSNLSLHIASSASSYHVEGALYYHNLESYFKSIIGYNTVCAPKKARNGIFFKNMLQITHSIPNRSIFVGDSADEAFLAIKFHMKFIMVKRNFFNKNESRGEEKLILVSDLTEIVRYIETFIN